MAISNYTELQEAIADWLDNATLTARLPDFITLAEAEINRRIMEAKARPAQARGTASMVVSDEYLTLPPDFAGVMTAEITSIPDTPIRLTYVAPDNLVRMKDDEAQRAREIEAQYGVLVAPPVNYTIVDDQFRFFPTPQQAYTIQIIYWAKLPPLASSSTNWLLRDHPDVYLYGALAIAAGFEDDVDKVTTWGGWFDRAVSGILVNYPTPTDHTPLRGDLGLLTTQRLAMR